MAKLFGKLSVRALLGGLIGIMGLVLSLMCANNLVNAWQHYDAGGRVTDLSIADKALFEAMQNFRLERGDSGSALNLSGAQSLAIKRTVDELRATVDAQLAIALPILERVSVPDLPAVRDKLKADYQVLKGLRARVDTAMQQPSTARDKDIVQSFMPKAASMLGDMEDQRQGSRDGNAAARSRDRRFGAGARRRVGHAHFARQQNPADPVRPFEASGTVARRPDRDPGQRWPRPECMGTRA